MWIYSPDVDIQSPACEKLFVLGGRSPDSAWLREFVRLNGLDVWAIDSGVMACRTAGLQPSVLVGDRDSATSGDWQWAVSSGAEEHLHDPDKNRTDFQLALDLLHNREGGSPILTGCFGGRTDHFLSILWTFYSEQRVEEGARFAPLRRAGDSNREQNDRVSKPQRPRCMIDHEEGFFFLHGAESTELLFKRRPVAVSLLAMSERCVGVSISGVRWPLSDVELLRDFPWSISNETAREGEPVVVSVAKGVLGISWSYFG